VHLITPINKKALSKIVEEERVLFKFPDTNKFAIDVAVGYPASYRVGMSNLALHFLYSGIKRRREFRVGRFFLDTAPFTVERGIRIAHCRLVFVTVSYEEDYFNLVRILERSGIEPLRDRRAASKHSRGEGVPIIIAGGPAVSANPAPVSEIVDAVVLGEGDDVLAELLEAAMMVLDINRDEFLERLASIEGIFVPKITSSRVPVIIASSAESYTSSAILTPNTAFPDTFLVEIGRGCPGWCNFCLARSIYGRFRYVPFDRLTVLFSTVPRGARVGLVSTAAASHPGFIEILELLKSRSHHVQVSSLRADDIDTAKARALNEVGVRSVALAPESGSERVRFILGKRVRDEVYFDAVASLRKAGIGRFSFYMMIGCPGEDEGALDESDHFLAELKRSLEGASASIHLNILIPKPQTPFQYLPICEERELARRLNEMKRIIVQRGFALRNKSVKGAYRQAVLSCGDESVGRAVVLNVVDKVPWKKALSGVDFDDSFLRREKTADAKFPWSNLRGPNDPKRLYSRYERSKKLLRGQ